MLLVSPVALGEAGISSLAVEALDALDSVEAQVELDYLLPPTFSALVEHLSSKTNHYHLVHFDGIISSGSDSLLFETAEGRTEPVPAPSVAGVLAAAGVPIALLNAGRVDPPGLQGRLAGRRRGAGCRGRAPGCCPSFPPDKSGPRAVRPAFLPGYSQGNRGFLGGSPG